MLSKLTIPKKQTREAAVDYQQLYLAGVQHVQNLASRIWTDYNVHDPGMTTLELLCYALTDLGYRAAFPVADLLTGRDGKADKENSLFTAPQILPNRPLTLLDYRKLLIDVKNVKNAWLQRSDLTFFADTVNGELLRDRPERVGIEEVKVAGLYDVLIEYSDNISAAAAKAALQAAKARLQANRNLCEDFVNFAEVELESFLICAELEISHEADEAMVKAELLFQAQQYLAPPVNCYTLSAMLERKKADGQTYTIDEIFTGPLLESGFIDDAGLVAAELRTEIRLSDLVNIIMDIPGVVAVRQIILNPEGCVEPPENRWVIPVTSGKKAILNFKKSRLTFYRRNMPVDADEAKVADYLNTLSAKVAGPVSPLYPDLSVPVGRFRQPAGYYSFQNHFPEVYGLSHNGLSSHGDDRRRALAYQLKAYLLFFDQIMANYLSQLSHVKELFSIDPGLKRTYFQKAVASFLDFEKIYGSTAVVDGSDASVKDNGLLEDDKLFQDRRNRFLDHLIARFAERFNEYAANMYASFGAKPEGMIADKCAFLHNYEAISKERSLAYNCTLKDEASLWNSDNVSGFEKRLAGLLGIRNCSRRNLGEIAYDIYAEVDKTPNDEFRFRIRKKDTGKIILSSTVHYVTRDLAREGMRLAIRAAMQPSGYARQQTSDGRFYFNVVNGSGDILARRVEYFKESAQMEIEIVAVMEYLQVNYSDEGMFVVESILLRPEKKDDPFLPICAAANRYVSAESDPYTYRLHIILPAEGGRFAKMEFRRYAEEVIREETPAHILPRICWVSKEDMALLEKPYRDWIYLKAGAETADRQEKLTRFIYTLFAVKNVYPKELLRECGSGNKFVLGWTALGSMDNSQ
jgi:uncharacterized protein